MKFIIFILALISLSNGENVTRAFLYSGGALDRGSVYTLVSMGNIPDLTPYSILNGVRSACATGIWVMHHEAQYSGTSTLFVGRQDCGENFAVQRKSIRFAGFRDNIHQSSISLYSGDWFKGSQMIFDSDQETISESFNSAVVTGSEAYSLFTESNFEGKGFCIVPRNDGSDYFFAIATNLMENGIISVGSVRKGCDSKNLRQMVWNLSAKQSA